MHAIYVSSLHHALELQTGLLVIVTAPQSRLQTAPCVPCGPRQQLWQHVMTYSPGHALLRGRPPNLDASQEAIIHIHNALPCDGLWVNV